MVINIIKQINLFVTSISLMIKSLGRNPVSGGSPIRFIKESLTNKFILRVEVLKELYINCEMFVIWC